MSDNQALLERYGLKSNPTRGLIYATFGFFVGFAAVSLYGPAAKVMKESMGLSGLLLGFLVAAPQLTGSLLRIPFGAWVDEVGGRKPMLTLLALSCLGMLGLISLLYFFQGRLTMGFYPLVLLFGFLSGCGVATFSVGIPQTSYWFPRHQQGLALGTYAGLGNTAPGIFVLIIPLVLKSLGITVAYTGWFVFLVLGTLVYHLGAEDAYFFQLARKMPREEAQRIAAQLGQEIFPTGTVKDALRQSARIGRTWALVALYFTSFGGFLALTTWLPAYWTLYLGKSTVFAGVMTAVFFSLLASFIRIAGGGVSDRIGGERTAVISFSVVLAGALVMVFAGSVVPAFLGEVLIGAGMGVANAAVFKLVPKYVPEAVGGASGWVGGLGAFGGFVVPPLLGLFVDMFGSVGYARGFLVYVVLALIAIVISVGLGRHDAERRTG